MRKLDDVNFRNEDGSLWDGMVSLSRLTGKRIKDIALQPVPLQDGSAVLAIMRVDFEDGTHLNAHADADEDRQPTPYLEPGEGLTQPGFDEDTVGALCDEWYGDE